MARPCMDCIVEWATPCTLRKARYGHMSRGLGAKKPPQKYKEGFHRLYLRMGKAFTHFLV
jgi:hypothetical protein